MTDQPERLKTALADRYAIERELGQGGMATVYLAQDRKLGRAVALKVLRPELAFALGSERFLREIEIAAKLSHPHILALYDCGEADGLLYYTMPFVAGESLRDRLIREKQLPLEDALQLTREVADALSYAHARGVVHRDIKPENILLESGHAVVADFGIARAIAAAGSARLTETGLVVGTPAYMSPEQAAGGQDLDGRSDLYSLGCVLWEMLSGETPYTGPTPQAILAKKLSEPLPRISVVRSTVPADIEAALGKALERTPADRFATAAQFATALRAGDARAHGRTDAPAHRRTGVPGSPLTRWLVGGGVVAAIVGALFATGVLRSGRAPAGGAEEPLRSVAVLPFTSLGDTTQAYLGDGFTEAAIDALVRVPGLGVPASGRVFAYRGRDVREVGRELGVAMVVTGSVQVAGSRLRVRTQLVRVADGTSVWSHQYDSDMAGVFPTQDSIAAGIVEALQVRVAGAAGAAAVGRGVRTRDMEAYRLYLQARRATYEGGVTRAGLEQAITLLDQALARDSTFADAWVALADAMSYYPSIVGGLPPAEVAGRWRRAAERGIALDSLNGFALALRGQLRASYDWDWNGAWSDMRRAVRLSPASADVAWNYSAFLVQVGQPDSGLAQMRRGLALDPANLSLIGGLAYSFSWAGMPDSAVATARRVLALDSTQWGMHGLLLQIFADNERRTDVTREIELMLRDAGETPGALSLAAACCGLAGLPDCAREMLRRLEEVSRGRYVEWPILAISKLAGGDRAGFLDALEEAARTHDLSLPGLLMSYLPELAGNPRFEALRQRVYGNIPAPRGWPRVPLRTP